MQLLLEHTTISTGKGKNMDIKESSAHNIEVKEKLSSNASLFQMNPVESGDNMLTGLSSGKLKDDIPVAPQLVPCCEGKELQISEDLVHCGLSAISVRHESVIQCLSMSSACEKSPVSHGLVKHRNSFRSLHRPDLKRVPYLRRMSPDELESLFRGYADVPLRERKRENVKDNRVVGNKSEMPRSNRENLISLEDGLHPIPEARSGADDVPAGMRLHGAKARLYTSVLAGARAGDHVDNACASEDVVEDTPILVDNIPEDEIPFREQLQIILPPRCDDVTAGSSLTNSEHATS